MRMLDNNSSNASGPTGAAALPGVQAGGAPPSGGVTTLPCVTDERMDASSDSAVSSMGSERVGSIKFQPHSSGFSLFHGLCQVIFFS